MFEPTPDMFPGFDVPPQHAETIGARKARKAREEEAAAAQRSSSGNSQSSASLRSLNTASATSQNASSHKSKEKSTFGGWFSRQNKKGVQEISPLPHSAPQTVDMPPPVTDTVEPERNAEPDTAPAPPTEPLKPLLDTDMYLFPRPPSRSADKQHQLQQPRLSSLVPMPYPPPTGELPPTPVLSSGGFGGLLDTGPRSNSSRRTSYIQPSVATSKASIFSSASGYETIASDMIPETASYAKSNQLSQGPVFEAVERGSRAGSTRSNERDHGRKAAMSPFARALAKIERAGTRIVSTRLGEEWEGLDDDESFQEIMFEKRLWALTAYQRLTQNKSLQSPVHELLINARPSEQRRVLQIHGSIADGWILANRYPSATVYTVSSKQIPAPTAYPAPINHHSLYVPSLSSQSPFPDNYFDAIMSRSVATLLKNDEWARLFFDCMRVLKPGGQMEILSVDAHMSCEGPKLSSWVDDNLSCRLESSGVSKQASDTVLDTMEIVGLENIRRARIALPAHLPRGVAKSAPPPSHIGGAPTPQDIVDNTKMMALLGRHFYQTLYGKFMSIDQGDPWFWSHKEIRDECEHYKTKMILTIACAQKAGLDSHDDEHSD